MNEYILWAIPAGSDDELDSRPIYTQGKTAEDVERVKGLAGKDGWHSFRVQRLDGTVPEFGKTLNM